MLTTKITIEELQKFYVIAARVVNSHGDAYLPIFERLHAEIQILEKSKAIKSIALDLASAIVEKDSELTHRVAHKPVESM